nr:helix-turn-helix domain-containing protein [Candidatus Neomarinimicrobiota bacterium]
MTKTIKTILKPEEAAEYLGISKDKLLRLFNQDKIPGKRLGYRTIRFSRGQLDEFIINGGNTDLLV